MFTITNATVFDGHEALPGRHDVQVDGDTISAIARAGSAEPAGAIVDGGGGTLLPGLIDGHVHLRDPEDFTALLTGGVTGAADMATWPRERLRALRTHSGGLAFRSAGAPLIGPAGPHSHMPGLADAVISSPEIARREVALRVDQGVDYIKLVLEAAGRGGPAPDAARAAVDAAHAADLRVVAHASAVGAIELAVEIGVDILTHAPLDGTVPDELVAQIVRDEIVVIPTLIMMRTTAQRRGVPEAYQHAKSFVTAIHGAGATLVVGSDANNAPGAPAAVAHATGARDELALLVDAGLSPVEALRAATSTAATVFGWENRGALQVGKTADLVLVDGSPDTDIAQINAIRTVWLAGQPMTTPAR